MAELIDNLTQFLTALLGFALSGASYLKCRRQPLFLLSCFTAALRWVRSIGCSTRS